MRAHSGTDTAASPQPRVSHAAEGVKDRYLLPARDGWTGEENSTHMRPPQAPDMHVTEPPGRMWTPCGEEHPHPKPAAPTHSGLQDHSSLTATWFQELTQRCNSEEENLN